MSAGTNRLIYVMLFHLAASVMCPDLCMFPYVNKCKYIIIFVATCYGFLVDKYGRTSDAVA